MAKSEIASYLPHCDTLRLEVKKKSLDYNTGGQAQIKKVCFHTLSVNSHQRCDFTLNSIAVKVWFHTLSVNSHHGCDFTLFTQFFRKCDFTLWVWNHTQSVISHFLTYFTPLQRWCVCPHILSERLSIFENEAFNKRTSKTLAIFELIKMM